MLLKINLKVWQLVFMWMIQAPLLLQPYLFLLLLDFILILFLLSEWKCIVLIMFLCTCYYLTKADNWTSFLRINKVLLYCMCVDDTYKPCYGLYSTTVVTILFWVIVCIISRYSRKFILLESYLFHFSWSWPFAIIMHVLQIKFLCDCDWLLLGGGLF